MVTFSGYCSVTFSSTSFVWASSVPAHESILESASFTIRDPTAVNVLVSMRVQSLVFSTGFCSSGGCDSFVGVTLTLFYFADFGDSGYSFAGFSDASLIYSNVDCFNYRSMN
jgi:hypothetical protein